MSLNRMFGHAPMKRPAYLAIFVGAISLSLVLSVAAVMAPHDQSAIVILLVSAFVGGLLATYIGSIVWAYSDAKRRGKPGWAIAILVAFLSWPLGLLLWYVFCPARICSRWTAVEKSIWK